MKRFASFVFPLLTFAALAIPQKPPQETGKFRLHKFEQPIGEETYTISRNGDELVLESDFKFTDRGTAVPLKAKLRQSAHDLRPRSFKTEGSTSRQSTIRVAVTVEGRTAHIESATGKKDVPLGNAQFFTIAGYAPVSLQQAVVRYWLANGKPATLEILPLGNLRIIDRGINEITTKGDAHKFHRYSINGLVWGLETVWLDEHQNLAALTTRDAEFDHFEAMREEYEPALSQFLAAGAADEMAQLAELSTSLPGRETGPMAFIGATLIDGTGKPAVVDATVLTADGKIVAAGSSSSIPIPKDANRVDVSGKFIIPGLWDMHAHYEQVEWGPVYLAAGVTTVRDVGNEFDVIPTIRDSVNAGTGLGPRLLLAGLVDGDSPMALGVNRVESPEDAKRWVQEYHDAGFQQIKIYSSVKLENLEAICREAHQLGMTVTGHIPFGLTVYDGVSAGMDQVNHINFLTAVLMPKANGSGNPSRENLLQTMKSVDVNAKEGQELIAFLKQHRTVIDDTIALFSMMAKPQSKPMAEEEPGVMNVAPELREQLLSMGTADANAAFEAASLRVARDLLRALHRAGIPVVAGTDQAVPGYSVYRELEIYVEAGFTPMEALQAATIVPAQVMKVDSDSGTVEAGKRADFDILDANPLENIHNIRSVRKVVANGVLYESAPLWRSVGFSPPAATTNH